MEFKKGDIFHDTAFIYPGTTKECNKWLLVLNKAHKPGDPLIAAPATHSFNQKDYFPACNLKPHTFYINKPWTFFDAQTLIQFYKYKVYEEEDIRIGIKYGCITKKEENKHSEEELKLLFKCLLSYKRDIDEDLHEFIF